MNRFLYSLILGLCILPISVSQGQTTRLPLSSEPLTSLDGFRSTADNWRIAGGVETEHFLEGGLRTTPGTGILVNLPSASSRENILSAWEHGDMELELEYLLPKGSNAGVYLQGRYEIQLFDSWGVQEPTFADAGGIYERWDPDRPEGKQGYEGHPPRMNVSRAPGLWQRLRINFQAPRFNDHGEKVENARMLQVEHNGVVIHENVELTGPTRAAAFSDEMAMGPLMIQGDHGQVAIRNLRYRQHRPGRIRISDTRYAYASGPFDSIPDFSALAPETEADVSGIDWRVTQSNDQFAMQFRGTMHIPFSGSYRFALGLTWITGDPHDQGKSIGAGALSIDGRRVLHHSGTTPINYADVELEEGNHSFELTYFKNRSGRPSFSLTAEGEEMAMHSLNAPGSLPPPPTVGSIFVRPDGEPALIRGFVDYTGAKKTHAIAVGYPNNVHYTLDLQQGSLLHIWKGEFIETTDMWHSRGTQQLAVPQGSVITMPCGPTVAHLGSVTSAWPDSMGTSYLFEGYVLDEHGYPSFQYSFDGLSVSDRLLPEQEGKQLFREITLTGEGDGYSIRMASGQDVTMRADGIYKVDDGGYYIRIHESGMETPVIRTTNSGQELLIPIDLSGGQTVVRYDMIW